MCCPSCPLERLWKCTLVHCLQLGQLHLFKVNFLFLVKKYLNLFCFLGFLWAREIWFISSNSIFAPLAVLSTYLSEVISFHLLRQDAMFPALNFLFDILIYSSIFLTCVSQSAGLSALGFNCNYCCLLFYIILICFVKLPLRVILSGSLGRRTMTHSYSLVLPLFLPYESLVTQN